MEKEWDNLIDINNSKKELKMFKCCYCNTYLIQNIYVNWNTKGVCPCCQNKIFVEYYTYNLGEEFDYEPQHIFKSVKKGDGDNENYLEI